MHLIAKQKQKWDVPGLWHVYDVAGQCVYRRSLPLSIVSALIGLWSRLLIPLVGIRH